jgi:uncharacterized membrane protein (UPF0127 family)
MTSALARTFATILSAVAGLSVTPHSGAEELPLRVLHIARGTLSAEVPQTEAQKMKGLMNRRYLDRDAGMLFSFTPPHMVAMWMKNTLIPLDAAFVDECGRIVRIAHMEPLTLTLHDSVEPVSHVIEANAGWFRAQGATSGTLVKELRTEYCPKSGTP